MSRVEYISVIAGRAQMIGLKVGCFELEAVHDLHMHHHDIMKPGVKKHAHQVALQIQRMLRYLAPR